MKPRGAWIKGDAGFGAGQARVFVGAIGRLEFPALSERLSEKLSEKHFFAFCGILREFCGNFWCAGTGI